MLNLQWRISQHRRKLTVEFTVDRISQHRRKLNVEFTVDRISQH